MKNAGSTFPFQPVSSSLDCPLAGTEDIWITYLEVFEQNKLPKRKLNGLFSSHYFSLSGVSISFLLKHRRKMEVLSVASMPMPILQINKAGVYSPIRGAFSGQIKFVLFTENRKYTLPSRYKKERYQIGRAITIQHREACIYIVYVSYSSTEISICLLLTFHTDF